MNWTLPLAKSLWAAERRTSSTIDARRGASAFPAALMSHRSSQRKRRGGADGPPPGAGLGQTAAPPLMCDDDDDDNDPAAKRRALEATAELQNNGAPPRRRPSRVAAGAARAPLALLEPPPCASPPPAAGASSTEAQLAEACAQLARVDCAAATAKREASQQARDEAVAAASKAVATFDSDAAAEEDTYALARDLELLITNLRRTAARAAAGGVGEAPGLRWVCSKLRPGCPCREGVRPKDAFPVDASWFRPGKHAQLARLFDEALQAYEEAVAAGRDDDAAAALRMLEGDKDAQPKLKALRTVICASCLVLCAAGTAKKRASGDAAVVAIKVAKFMGKKCASPFPWCRVVFSTEELVRAFCTFQHTPDSDPKPPGAHGPGADMGYEDIGHRVNDAAKCDGWCLACNQIHGITEARAKSLRERPLEERSAHALSLYRRKQENHAYVFHTYKEGRVCHYCPLKCTTENQTGFCMCHTPAGALCKFKKGRRKGMSGICDVGASWTFEDFKARADEERTLCHDYIACANCHKRFHTDKGLWADARALSLSRPGP